MGLEVGMWIVGILLTAMGFLLSFLITNTTDKVNEVDKSIRVVSKNLSETREVMVSIQKDVEYLKRDVNQPKRTEGRFIK